MIDLYTLLVMQVFGSFWMAVAALVLILVIILAMGAISSITLIFFVGMFIYSMALGYGYALVTVPLSILIVWWAYSQYQGSRDHTGGN